MLSMIALIGALVAFIVAVNKKVNWFLALLGCLVFWPAVLIYALCVNKHLFKSVVEARMWIDAEYPEADARLKNKVAMFMMREVYSHKDLADLPKRFPELEAKVIKAKEMKDDYDDIPKMFAK